MPNTAFTATDLGHAYGKIAALHSLDVSVPRGRTGLVGANGAGKSTLIKILLGILDPTVGSTTVLDMDPRQQLVDIRSVIGYMPEGMQAARQRASDVLTLVGLDEERFRYLGDFSTGMKQRAKLAQAIVHDPELVFLDEPTSGLDPSGREEMLELISRLGTFGIDVVVSSHVLRDIERTCDWVVMLDEGTVLHTGPIGASVDEHTVRVEYADDPVLIVAALTAAGAEVTLDGRRLAVRHDRLDVFDLVRDTTARLGGQLRRLEGEGASLEELFIRHGDMP